MNILFLRGFNNYFNRKAKVAFNEDIQEYKADAWGGFVEFDDVNFNPNDGIATELVVGNENQKEDNKPLDWDVSGAPDYCICFEMIGTPAHANIVSRWFVLESERLRSGQYRIALKRDVIVDYYNNIKKAPCFIEKGMIDDIDNPLLYNKESMTYNQIKEKEIPLKDGTESGWIVGYVPKNKPNSTDVSNMPTIETTILLEGDPLTYYDSADLPFSVSTSTTYAFNSTEMEIEFAQFGSYADTEYSTTYWGALQSILSYTVNSDNTISRLSRNCAFTNTYVGNDRPYPVSNVPGKLIEKGYWYASSAFGTKRLRHISALCESQNSQAPSLYGYCTGSTPTFMTRNSNSIETVMSTMRAHAKTACSTAFSSYGPIVDNIEQYDGKYVKYNNNFYKMKIQKSSWRTGVFKVNASSTWNINRNINQYEGLNQYASFITNSTDLENLRQDVGTFFSTAYTTSSSNYVATGFDGCGIAMPSYSIQLVSLSTETLVLSNRAYTSRGHTYDNSADVFAIPYGEINLADDGTEFTTTAFRALAMGRAIASSFGDSCYDLQLVPYCPSQTITDILAWYINHNEACDVSAEFDTESYQVFYDSFDSPAGVVFWCSTSKGSFDINLVLEPDINYQGSLSDALVYKISNETELCRLASPNYNGQFEFSIAKNKGVLKFNVDYTYKPYAPYIHVNPDFKGLYGQDWDDARGLICGGDFSLNHITSYWQTYMNNNKNFQQIFDRQIQNIDVNNAIALEKQEFQATVGTITSAIGGAMGGAVAGASAGSLAGPWGALAGGIVGAVGGGLGSGLASAYGAEKDKDWLQRQQAESKSYAIDMYGYQLGNIRAVPYSIKGSEALTNNNKIWPIIEVYEPTYTEVELLKSKIEFNGMTIMAVGDIDEFCKSDDFEYVFIKGQLIRFSDHLADDFHIADAIYQEINKGVYIPSGGL